MHAITMRAENILSYFKYFCIRNNIHGIESILYTSPNSLLINKYSVVFMASYVKALGCTTLRAL